MALDDHKPVPKDKTKWSITGRSKSKEHQKFCDDWTSATSPYPCSAHHILPVTCFNPVQCKDRGNLRYIVRCLRVSEWNINGGNRFPAPSKKENNMVRLPTGGAYKKRYRNTVNLAKVTPPYLPTLPVNLCSHSGRYCEHYPRYINEVNKWLQENVWKDLKEDKALHKLKGKSILQNLRDGEAYFRGELDRRGKRPPGTINGWLNKATDDHWMLPFSMAADPAPGAEKYCTQYPR